MANHRMTWLMVAIFCFTGVGCGHSRCSQCANPSAIPIAKHAATNQVCKPDTSIPMEQLVVAPVAPEAITSPRILDPNIAILLPIPASKPEAGDMDDAIVKTESAATAKTPRFDHSLDFAWVIGHLQYIHSSRQWRIRYLSCEVDDDYGGVLTITGAEHLADRFKDGAVVRLQGQLVDPDTRKAAPEYFTWGITVLE